MYGLLRIEILDGLGSKAGDCLDSQAQTSSIIFFLFVVRESMHHYMTERGYVD